MLRPRMTPCLDRAPYVDGCGLFVLHVGIVFMFPHPEFSSSLDLVFILLRPPLPSLLVC